MLTGIMSSVVDRIIRLFDNILIVLTRRHYYRLRNEDGVKVILSPQN
jgi:hypothetical protein